MIRQRSFVRGCRFHGTSQMSNPHDASIAVYNAAETRAASYNCPWFRTFRVHSSPPVRRFSSHSSAPEKLIELKTIMQLPDMSAKDERGILVVGNIPLAGLCFLGTFYAVLYVPLVSWRVQNANDCSVAWLSLTCGPCTTARSEMRPCHRGHRALTPLCIYLDPLIFPFDVAPYWRAGCEIIWDG
ncbi:hypothetical protein CC86DRAFT_99501 [Ophiobolus disseminans]|uniref:Uncharacterized protein n=1 Tax=Ophiobolus disseminans TaxID=1469910 RepID=A0A6A6ZKS4_9PLEO|nr:hypothetical protein CC86DRAFT_99501 [Ophiobolus disseminans]